MDKDRKAAFDILIDISQNEAYSNLAIKAYLEHNDYYNSGFIRELVYGVLENQIYFDKVIDSLASKGIKGIKLKELVLLRMGLCQILKMDSVPDYAAINETVNMAKKVTHGKDKFINGMLRSFLKRKDEDFSDGDLSVKYSYMPWIVELWENQYEDIEDLLRAGNMKPGLCIRANLSKLKAAGNFNANDEEIVCVEDLARRLDGKVSDITPRGILVKGNNILESEEYLKGLFSIQDETSILAADMIEPRSGEMILDMCAAPGGKTMAIAEALDGSDNSSRIIAMDIYEHKLDIIKRQCARLGISNVQTRCHDSTRLIEEYIGAYDKVLADVPCSGLGVIRHKPEIKLKEQGDMNKLYQVQEDILSNGAKYVKSGGTLIYSTCTINKRENENQVERFLKNNGDFEVKYMKQFLPHIDGTDGFFIAKLIHK